MKSKLVTLLVLTLCVGAFLFAGTTALAASETLSVDDVWLSGDTLHITVTDGGESQTLELRLSDYAKSGDEYVTVQVTDSAGRASNSIQFKNPYYVEGDSVPATPSGSTESAVSDGAKPFTPDGTGTVLDNAESGDGKEFFTVKTADGNVFYLIIDRQRTADNVYLLNPVTEDDLTSLAKPGNGKIESAIPTPTTLVNPTPQPMPEPTPAPSAAKSGGSGGTIAFVVIAVIAVGGVGYYIKIVRPKRQGAAEDDGEDYDYGEPYEDGEIDVENDEGDDEE